MQHTSLGSHPSAAARSRGICSVMITNWVLALACGSCRRLKSTTAVVIAFWRMAVALRSCAAEWSGARGAVAASVPPSTADAAAEICRRPRTALQGARCWDLGQPPAAWEYPRRGARRSAPSANSDRCVSSYMHPPGAALCGGCLHRPTRFAELMAWQSRKRLKNLELVCNLSHPSCPHVSAIQIADMLRLVPAKPITCAHELSDPVARPQYQIKGSPSS